MANFDSIRAGQFQLKENPNQIKFRHWCNTHNTSTLSFKKMKRQR